MLAVRHGLRERRLRRIDEGVAGGDPPAPYRDAPELQHAEADPDRLPARLVWVVDYVDRKSALERALENLRVGRRIAGRSDRPRRAEKRDARENH